MPPWYPAPWGYGDTGLPRDAAEHHPMPQERGQGTPPAAHITSLYCHSSQTQVPAGVRVQPLSLQYCSNSHRSMCSSILHPPSCILTPQSSSGASLPLCSEAGGETEGAERAKHPRVLPHGMQVVTSHLHTRCPSQAQCLHQLITQPTLQSPSQGLPVAAGPPALPAGAGPGVGTVRHRLHQAVHDLI